MKIGLETSSILTSNPTGISRYIKELVTQMLKTKESDDSLTSFYKLSRWNKRHLGWRSPDIKVKPYHNFLWPVYRSLDFFHILDATNIFCPRRRSYRIGITIHDILVLLDDNDDIAREKFRNKKAQLYTNLVKKSDVIFTVSETTKKDVVQMFGVPEGKIRVTYLGIDHGCRETTPSMSQKVLEQYGLREGYLLFLGAISGRKNTERLVRAYGRSKAAKERQLVLAGSLSYQCEKTLTAIAECRANKTVIVTGYLPDDYLAPLYRNAGAFVFPTLYEGFGMPILEAMDWGVPVLTSSTGAAPEVSGGHAICVDPYDIDAIADGIDQALNMNRDRLMRAKNHARSFSWRRCAEQTLKGYREVF